MKKIYKYILIITVMIFGFMGEVKANTYDVHVCVEKGKCKLICSYKLKDEDGKEETAFIYYVEEWRPRNHGGFAVSFSWSNYDFVYPLFDGGDYMDEEGVQGDNPLVFLNTYSFVHEDLVKSFNDFVCPENVYKNDISSPEICFDNDENKFCESKHGIKFKKKLTVIDKNGEKIEGFEDVTLSATEFKEKIKADFGISEQEILEVCVFNSEKSKDGTADQIALLTQQKNFRYFTYVNDGYVDSFSELTSGTLDNGNTFNNFIKYNEHFSCLGLTNVYLFGMPMGNGAAIELHDKSTNPHFETKYITDRNPYYISGATGDDSGTKNENCESIFGQDLIEEISSWLIYIKIAVPIIIIVMGSIDFGAAFIASDEEKMKKAQKKFIMRIIIGLVIFFIPALVNVLLDIANKVWGISSGTCGITF